MQESSAPPTHPTTTAFPSSLTPSLTPSLCSHSYWRSSGRTMLAIITATSSRTYTAYVATRGWR